MTPIKRIEKFFCNIITITNFSFCAGNTYYNAPTNESSVDQSDQCYYNMDGNKSRPETAISVEKLPDVVLQPEFRETLDEQFKASGNYILS